MSEQTKPDFEAAVREILRSNGAWESTIEPLAQALLAAHRAELAAVEHRIDGIALGALSLHGIATPAEGFAKAGWGWLEKNIDDLAIQRDRAIAELVRLTEVVPCPKCGGTWERYHDKYGVPCDCADGKVRVAKGAGQGGDR